MSSNRLKSVGLPVIRPSIRPPDIDTTGRIGAVAYPYTIYRTAVTIPRPLIHDRETSFVVSVDRSRRLAIRADVVPEVEQYTFEEVLRIPSELSDDQVEDKARDTVFHWVLRKYSLHSVPEIEFEEQIDAFKVFWVVEQDGDDLLIDSVRGNEEPVVE